MHFLKDLPIEIWISILDQFQDLNSIRNVTIIKPEIFYLYPKLNIPLSAIDCESQTFFRELDSYQKVQGVGNMDFNIKHKVPILEVHISSSPVNGEVEKAGIAALYVTFKPQYCVFHTPRYVEISDTSFTLPSQLLFLHTPKIYLFNELQFLQRTFQGSIEPQDRLTEEVEVANEIQAKWYANLKDLTLEGVRKANDMSILLQDLNLPELERLSLKGFDLKTFLNLKLPKLQTLELDFPAMPFNDNEFEFLEFIQCISPPVRLDFNSMFDVSDQNVGYVISPLNHNFDFQLKFKNLEKFSLKMSLHNPRVVEHPLFIYFLTDKIIPYETTLKELDLYFGDKDAFQDPDEDVFDESAIALTKYLTLGAVVVAMKKSKKNLEKLTLRSSSCDHFLFSIRLINQLNQMKVLKELTLGNVEITLSDTNHVLLKTINLPNLEKCFLHYERITDAISEINIKSEKLRKLTLKFDGFLMPKTNKSYIDYINKLKQNCPNLDELHLSYFCTVPSFQEDRGSDPSYAGNLFIFKATETITWNIRVLSLNLELSECFKFFLFNKNLNLPNCQILRVKNKVGTYTETFVRRDTMLYFLDRFKNTIPTIQLNAPNLTILDLGFQCFRWPRHNHDIFGEEYHTDYSTLERYRDVFEELLGFFNKIKIMDMYPNLRLILHPDQYCFVENVFVARSIGKRISLRGISVALEDEFDSDADDIVENGIPIFEPYEHEIVKLWFYEKLNE